MFLVQDNNATFDNIVNYMRRAEDSLVYDNGVSTFTKATNIRLLLHWFGDIHQPLHNAVFYNSTM